MALYKIVRDGGPYKMGTFVEDIDEELVQPTTIIEGKAMYSYGIALPRKDILDYAVRIQSRGLDRQSLQVLRG